MKSKIILSLMLLGMLAGCKSQEEDVKQLCSDWQTLWSSFSLNYAYRNHIAVDSIMSVYRSDLAVASNRQDIFSIARKMIEATADSTISLYYQKDAYNWMPIRDIRLSKDIMFDPHDMIPGYTVSSFNNGMYFSACVLQQNSTDKKYAFLSVRGFPEQALDWQEILSGTSGLIVDMRTGVNWHEDWVNPFVSMLLPIGTSIRYEVLRSGDGEGAIASADSKVVLSQNIVPASLPMVLIINGNVFRGSHVAARLLSSIPGITTIGSGPTVGGAFTREDEAGIFAIRYADRDVRIDGQSIHTPLIPDVHYEMGDKPSVSGILSAIEILEK